MPQGLQAWDASGRIVVDLGDYSTRFVTSISPTLAAGQSAMQIAVSGITDTGHFAVITKGNSSVVSGLLMTELTAVTYNGGVWLIGITGAYTVARPVVIDIYAFV
nr:MAG TPA: hypothetical protein [Caudoviricetes sp.]